MKPIMILPPNVVSDDDIKKLNDNGLCTIVATDPAAVRFLDPIPAAQSRTKIEEAAIQLSRKLLARQSLAFEKKDIVDLYVQLLVDGTPLDPRPSKEEREKRIYDESYDEEIRRQARQDAKEERDRKKAEKAKAEEKGKKKEQP